MQKLDEMRSSLAEIDREIISLVGRRSKIAEKIGVLKSEENLEIVVPKAEEAVVERYIDAGKKFGVSSYAASRIARAVIDESVDVQGKVPRYSKPKVIFIIGGNGGMGRWLSDFFSSRGHSVFINDINLDGAEYPYSDLSKCLEADAVIIASPLSVSADILRNVLALKPKCLIFDILSVKAPVKSLLIKAALDGFNICSVHPMFGPSAPSPAGRIIIACDCGCESAVRKAEELFSGGTILTMPVEEHDRVAAYVLGLSHAVNIAFSDALLRCGYSFKELSDSASTTFRKQISVSREVSMENAELYYSIQRENDENDKALESFEDSVRRVRTLSHDDFIEMMRNESEWYQGL